MTELTIVGSASRTISSCQRIEQVTYEITKIILDTDDITTTASLDMQQINNACLNFAESLFSKDLSLQQNIPHFPVSVIAN